MFLNVSPFVGNGGPRDTTESVPSEERGPHSTLLRPPGSTTGERTETNPSRDEGVVPHWTPTFCRTIYCQETTPNSDLGFSEELTWDLNNVKRYRLKLRRVYQVKDSLDLNWSGSVRTGVTDTESVPFLCPPEWTSVSQDVKSRVVPSRK